ncbi:MAG TPA: hypothetical protein VGM58_04315 [Verrucomicrobiae bacterium]|jgi:hypothetical protein
MRHFKVQTAAGTEDVYCDDFDESEQEYWFICYSKPKRIFQKANVISYQEVARLSDKAWQTFVDKGEDYRKLLQSKQLK